MGLLVGGDGQRAERGDDDGAETCGQGKRGSAEPGGEPGLDTT